MSYTLTGKITEISEKQTLNNGGAKLSFRVDTGDQYNDPYEFELYKGEQYLEHLDNFIKFNKVGDNVTVEFNLKSKLWVNPETKIRKTFTSLSCWKVEKLGDSKPTSSTPEAVIPETDVEDDLPF